MNILKRGKLKKNGNVYYLNLVRSGTEYFYEMIHEDSLSSQNTCPSKTALRCFNSLDFYKRYGWEVEVIESFYISESDQQELIGLVDGRGIDIDVRLNGDGFVTVFNENLTVIVEREKFVNAVNNLVGDNSSVSDFWASLEHQINLDFSKGQGCYEC